MLQFNHLTDNRSIVFARLDHSMRVYEN